MKRSVLLGFFEEEEAFLDAVRAARAEGLSLEDAFTPYAVHGLEDAMGLKPSRLPWVTLGCALFGLTFALWMQIYTSVESWPLNVGGKPLNSLPAFIPVAFELTVLCAGLGTAAALLWRTGVLPGSPKRALPRVTDDRFAVAVQTCDVHFDADRTARLLQRWGAVETRVEELR